MTSNWPMWLFILVIVVLIGYFYFRSRKQEVSETYDGSGNYDYLEERFSQPKISPVTDAPEAEDVLKEAENIDASTAGYATEEARSELDDPIDEAELENELATETFDAPEVETVDTVETPSFVETNAEVQETPLADAVVEEKKTTRKKKIASKKAGAIFSKKDIQYIRSKTAKSLTNRQLAEKFNCSASTISSVRNYQTYADVR